VPRSVWYRFAMAAAIPLSLDDDFEVFEGDDLAMFSPEGQAAIRAAEARVAAGTAVLVPHEEIEAIVDRQRLAAIKAG
jgi:hypothetical protein